MNMYIDRMILWLKDGKKRELSFLNNKVNVITGNSKTGKTAILEIIDYCLGGSSDTVTISDEHIGENVCWYGLRIIINEKLFTIARGPIGEEGEFSQDYYFSSIGEIPVYPEVTISIDGIKDILNAEFSIDDNITISHGGSSIRKGNRLSYRFFLMLNTLSKDIIDNGKKYFDKIELDRYRESWDQVFDLALDVINAESISLQNDITTLQQDIAQLELQIKKREKNELNTKRQINQLVKEAKESQIIEADIPTDEAIKLLISIMSEGPDAFARRFTFESEYEQLILQQKELDIQIAKLTRFQRSYQQYKNHLQDDADALKPAKYLQDEFSDVLTGEFAQFVKLLVDDLTKVKNVIVRKRPFEIDISSQLTQLKQKWQEVSDRLSNTPHISYTAIPISTQLIKFGELISAYKAIDFPVEDVTTLTKQLTKAYDRLNELQSQYSSVEERRQITIATLNDYIQKYIDISAKALDEYGTYRAWFDYKNRRLTLRKNMHATFAKISSSSDHLYMHMCLFAGMHHMMVDQQTPYVPSLLILDQPSRPYFNKTQTFDYRDSKSNISNKSDWAKVQGIFALWDKFVDALQDKEGNYTHDFQILVLEHVEADAWKECKNIHLVEVFDGVINALIPPTSDGDSDDKSIKPY